MAADEAWTPALLQLTVNDVDKGAIKALIHGQDILLAADALHAAGITSISGTTETIDGAQYVRLSTLGSAIQVHYDQDNLALALTVEPKLLAATSIDLGTGAPPDIEYVMNKSAFVNYAFTANDASSLSFLSEQGFSFDGRLFDNNLSVNSLGQTSRGSTSLTLDNRDKLTRLVFGDAIATGSVLGGTAQIAGLSYSRNFGINPYFTPYPGQRFAGTVTTPSTADIYVNGILVRSVDLAPGPFNLQNLPAVSGAGSTRVVVRNAFGESQELGSAYYLSTQALRKGVSDFGYNVGAERTPFTVGFGNYSGPALMAFHRYGLTDWATPGAFIAADHTKAAAGPEVTLALPIGTLALFGAGSEERGQPGNSAAVQYNYQSTKFSFGGSFTRDSPHYATLGLDAFDDRETSRVDAFVGAPIGSLASLTLDLSGGYFRDAGKSVQTDLTAATRLGERYNLSTTLSHAENQNIPANNGIFLSLTMALGHETTATASVNRDRQTGTSAVAQIQKSLPTSEGFGYLAQASAGAQPRDVADVQYQGRYGLYEVDATHTQGTTTTVSTISGALVGLGGRVFATRPVQDAYGLIRVPGVPNVTGLVSNLPVGETDSNGDLLVPNLLSYYGNRVGIDDKDIPIDHTIASTERVISPPLRGGAVIEFPVTRLQAFQGTLIIKGGKQVVVPAYGELSVVTKGKSFKSPIGAQGEFYLDSVPAGTYPATIAYADGACQFNMNIPVTQDNFVKMGQVACTAP